MIEHLTFDTFKDKIMDLDTKEFKNKKPVVLKFGADAWCMPCRAYKPIFEKVSNEVEGVDFYSVDVDDESELSSIFSIRSVPTTVVINTEGRKDFYSGLMQQTKLMEMISNNL